MTAIVSEMIGNKHANELKSSKPTTQVYQFRPAWESEIQLLRFLLDS